MLPRFETERLILRSPQEDDLDNIYRLGSSSTVMRYISNGKTQTRVEAKADLERRIKTSTTIFGYWIVEEKSSGQFVGWLALKRLDNSDDIEVGYRFLEEYWGQGLATEGSRRLLQYAFQILNLQRVVAIALEANKASTRVMEKLGMQYCKKDRYYGFDVVVYEIFQKDFIENFVNS
jgi:RimJ/RimL family protein N-acetyltransferase